MNLNTKFFYKASTILLLYYCYLACLRKMTFPVASVTVPLVLAGVLCMVVYAGQGRIIISDRADMVLCFSWCVIAAYLFINNNSLVTNLIRGGMIQLYVMICFMLFTAQKTEWIPLWIKWSQIYVLFHALATIVFYFNGSLYTQFAKIFYSGSELTDLMNYYKAGYMSGLFNHFSSNGMVLGIGIVFFFEDIQHCRRLKQIDMQKNKRLIYDCVSIVFVLYALILSSKRSPLFAAVIAIAFTYIIYKRKNTVRRIVILIISCFLIYGAYCLLLEYVPGLSTIIDKFQKLEDSQAGILNGRSSLWSIAFEMYRKNPVFGQGFGSYAQISKQAGAITTSAHNYYLQILSELGVVGFILYITAFISAVYINLRGIRQLQKTENEKTSVCVMAFCISLEIQVFVLIYNMTSTALMYYSIMIPYFMSCAAVRALRSCKWAGLERKIL